MPMPRRPTPTPRKDRIDEFEVFILCTVAKGRKIGNKAYIPEKKRDGRVRRNGKNVPYKRAPEIRPYSHRVRIREKPICRKPRTARMQQWEHRGAGHSE